MDAIKIDIDTKKILLSIFKPVVEILESNLKYDYVYDDVNLTGYIDKSIEPAANKETFAFKYGTGKIYDSLVNHLSHLGEKYIIEKFDYRFWNMHDQEPLIRFHRYYEMPDNDEYRFFPHYDYGTITFSYCYNDVRGMQWKTIDDLDWKDMEYNQNELKVFFGQIMDDFCFGKTYHRMINSEPEKIRYSLTCHFDLQQKFLGSDTVKKRLGIK